MTIKSILSQETPDAIQCYKHGVFWMAYEQSAYRIWQLKKYKPSYKYIKYLKQGVISVGFTDIGLKDMMSSFCKKEIEEEKRQGHIKFPLERATDFKTFIEWKERIKKETHYPSNIEDRLLSFPLESRSPMEAYVFLQQLQSELTKPLFYPSI